MLSIVTALVVAASVNLSSLGVKAGGEVQAVQPCCHCACCKGGVCKCGMHKAHAAARQKAPGHTVARQDANAGCRCRGSEPMSHPQSSDMLAPAAGPYGEFQFLHSLSAAAFLAPVQTGLMRGSSVIFNTGPPGLFRSIPLRI
jgi:hypothetical protein